MMFSSKDFDRAIIIFLTFVILTCFTVGFVPGYIAGRIHGSNLWRDRAEKKGYARYYLDTHNKRRWMWKLTEQEVDDGRRN